MVLENLDQADELSLEVLASSLEGDLPLFCLVTVRPPYELPGTWRRRARLLSRELPPLDPASARELLDEYLLPGTVPEERVHYMLDRAGGIPLFLEELAHAFEGHLSGTGESSADSLQEVVSSCLDRLEPGDRELIQVTSVIGPWAGRSMLEEMGRRLWGHEPGVLRQKIQRLLDVRLLVPARRGERAGFAFTSLLVQETIYREILPVNILRLHALAAEVLGTSSGDWALEGRASHLQKAGDLEGALECLMLALEQSVATFSHSRALRLADRVIHLLDDEGGLADSPGSRASRLFDALALKEQVLEVEGDRPEQRRVIGRMIEVARGIQDGRRLAAASNRKARYLWWHIGDIGGGLSWASEAIRLARLHGDHSLLARGIRNMACAESLSGNFDRSMHLHQEALEIFQRLQEVRGIGASLCSLAINSVETGEVSRGFSLVDTAQRIEGSTEDPRGLARCWRVRGDLLRRVGRNEEALQSYDEAMRIDRSIGFPESQAESQIASALSLHHLGRSAEALERLKDSFERARGVRSGALMSEALAHMSLCYLDRGTDPAREFALVCAEKAFFLAGTLEIGWLKGLSLTRMAHCHHSLGQFDRALDHSRKAVDMVKERTLPRIRVEEIQRVHGICCLQAGDAAEGRAALREARRIIDARAALLTDPADRESFLGRDRLCREILDG